MLKKIFFVESWWGCLLHLVIILALTAGSIWGFFFVYLPNTTNHNETIRVPNLENMDVKKAIHILDKQGLRCVPQDTTFSLKHKLGAVVNQQPEAGSLVKANRHIYVTVNRNDFPTVTVDSVRLARIRRTSLTQAKHELPLLGFGLGEVIEVPGFKNFVKECIANGDTLSPSETVELQIHTKIDLLVGNGEEEKDSVVVSVDTLPLPPTGDDIDIP
ncbi:MAG: PASTA domain-containing protein [Cytophagales bacterium]|nr:PASTA domain-containing protein [Cytophagales bacterium]